MTARSKDGGEAPGTTAAAMATIMAAAPSTRAIWSGCRTGRLGSGRARVGVGRAEAGDAEQRQQRERREEVADGHDDGTPPPREQRTISETTSIAVTT